MAWRFRCVALSRSSTRSASDLLLVAVLVEVFVFLAKLVVKGLLTVQIFDVAERVGHQFWRDVTPLIFDHGSLAIHGGIIVGETVGARQRGTRRRHVFRATPRGLQSLAS